LHVDFYALVSVAVCYVCTWCINLSRSTCTLNEL
jgi:hypothetical protein